MEMVVKVERITGRCIFKSSWERYVWENGEKTSEREVDENGVTYWNVKAELQQEGEDTDEIVVKVAMDRNPAEGLQYNEEVVFVGLVIESGKRRTGGRWETIKANKIVRKKREKSGEERGGK